MPPWLQILTAIISVGGTVAIGWITYRAQTRTKEIETTTPPYEQLAARVSALEGQVDSLRGDLHEARTYTHALITERPLGRPLPQPVPAYILGAYLAPTPTTIIEPPRSTQ